jgi:hypothetical protein
MSGRFVLPLRCASIAAVVLACSIASAQSFNIDIDSPTSPPTLGGGVPSSGFGAAPNQPGVWNSYPATSNPIALLDLSGGATGAAVDVTATSTSVTVLAFNNPSNTGDFALLFNDGSQIGTTLQGGTRTYSFSGLLNGPYSVVTYTGRPQGTNGDLFVDIPGSNEGSLQATGIPTGNTFTLGVTHVIHTLNVTTGSFDINLTDIAGDPAGYVGGFQLTLVPEPSVVGAGLIGLLLLGRRRG